MERNMEKVSFRKRQEQSIKEILYKMKRTVREHTDLKTKLIKGDSKTVISGEEVYCPMETGTNIMANLSKVRNKV